MSGIFDLPPEIIVLVLCQLSARDLTFSAQYVCSAWRTIIRSCQEVWTGSFVYKSNYEDEMALNYLRRSPLLQNLYVGLCEKSGEEICRLGKQVRVLRLSDPVPEQVGMYLRELPSLQTLEMEVGLHDINSGRIVLLRELIRNNSSSSGVEIRLVSSKPRRSTPSPDDRSTL